MPTLSGTRGEFTIPTAQTGLILSNQSEAWSATFLEALNLDGEATGFAMFNDMCEVSLEGEVPTSNPFSVRLAGAVTLGNAVSNHALGSGSVGSGNFFLTGATRTLPRGAWRTFSLTVRGMPNHV